MNRKTQKSVALFTVLLFLISALSVLSFGVQPAAATTTPASPTYEGQNFYFGLMSHDNTLDFTYPSYASSTWPNWSFWGQYQTAMVQPNPGSGTTITTVSCSPPSLAVSAFSTCTATVSDYKGAIMGEEIGFSVSSSSVPAPGSAADVDSYCYISVNSCSVKAQGEAVGWATIEATYWGGDTLGNSRSQGTFTLNVFSGTDYPGWDNALVSESGCTEVKPSVSVTLSQSVAIQATNSSAKGQNGFSIQMNIFGGPGASVDSSYYLNGWDQVVIVALPQGTSGLWYYSGTVEVWNVQAGIVFDGPWLNFSTNQPAPGVGWTFDLAATYANSSSYVMTGGQMKVYNALGAQVGSTMNIPIVMPPFPTEIPPQGPQYGMFTPFFPSVVYELNIVGQYNGALAKFNSGAGTITYSSSDGHAVQQYGSNYPDGSPCGYSEGNTAENSNIAYATPSTSGNSLVQSFVTQTATATMVACSPTSVATASSISCTAVVSGYSSTITGETISWKTSGSGSFSSTTCALISSGSPPTIECSVIYYPSSNAPLAITASYPGDGSNFASYGYASISGIPGIQKITQNGCDNQYPTGSGWKETVEMSPQVQGAPYGCGQWIDQQNGFTQSVQSTSSSLVAYQGILETQPDVVPAGGLTFSVQMTNLGAGSGTEFTFWDSKCIDQGLPQNGPQICSTGGTSFSSGGTTSPTKYTMWSVGDLGGKFAFIDPTGGVAYLTAAGSTGQVDSVEFLVRATPSELQVYYNIGSGYVLGATYTGAGLAWMGTDGGEALLWANTQSTSVQYNYFAYYSVWVPNQATVEGTFDNNMMNLAHHYDMISGGPFSGDAAITDTEAPPLVVDLSGGTGGTSAVLYAGMANAGTVASLVGLGAPSSTCASPCSVTQTFATGNTVYYYMTNGATDKLTILIATNPATTAWRTVYTITIHSTWSSYSTGGRVMSLYLGDDLLVSGLSVHTNESGTTYTVTEPFGLPGNRYVSRHITMVTSLLLSELGYGSSGSQHSGSAFNVAAPLANFIQEDMSLCHAASNFACSATTYTEYYGAMFPSYVSSLPSNWYYQYSTFPQAAFYDTLPYGSPSVSFSSLNPYGYGYSPATQFGAPYISRLAITSSSELLAAFPEIYFSGSTVSVDGAWVVSGQKNGYTPATQALKAEYTTLTGGSLASAETLLDSAGWDGMGTSLTVCLSVICTQQASYPTYDTATFLAAASVVGNAAGSSSRWYVEAEEAAGVLVAAEWPGSGYITNVNAPQPITDWRFIGGELAAYEPMNLDPAAYATNQAGIFADISGILQYFGISGVQPPESAGYIPVDTEATGLTAQALYTYLTYLPNVPTINTFGPEGAPAGATTPTVSGCSASHTGTTGYFLFNETSFGDCMVTYQSRITLPVGVEYASLSASFHVNGTVAMTASKETFVAAEVSLTSQSGSGIWGSGNNYTILTSSGAIDKEIAVSVETQEPIPAGAYILSYTFEFQGVGTFYSNSQSPLGLKDYVRIDGSGFTPNSLSENFLSNQGWPYDLLLINSNYWATSSYNNGFGTTGLKINLASSGWFDLHPGAEYDVQLISRNPFYYGTETALHFSGNITGQDITTSLCFGLSTVSDNGVLLSSQASYASFCEMSGGVATMSVRNQGGTVSTSTASVSGKNLQVTMLITGGPTSTLTMEYLSSTTGLWTSTSFALNWNTNNFYLYSYAKTSATSTQHVYLYSESIQSVDAPSGSIVASPVSPGTGAPTLTLSPTAGPAATWVGLTGGSYPVNTLYDDCLSTSSSAVSCVTNSVSTFMSTATGTIPAYSSVTVPSATTAGTYYVITYTGTTVATEAPFTVTTPAITLSPTSGLAGSSVTITGSGFTKSIGIGIMTFNGATPTTQTCTSSSASSSGAISCTFTVPSVTYGSYSVVVSGTDIGIVTADTASATFTVTPSPKTLAVSPTTGGVGEVITLTGSNYAQSTTYSKCLSTSSSAVSCVSGSTGSFTSNSAGAIPASTTVTVPAGTTVATDYVIVYSGSTVVTAATFGVAASILTISVASGPVGTVTTLTGAYYGSSTSYGICLSTSSSSVVCVSGSTGSFTSGATGTIPSSTTVTVPTGAATGADYVMVYSGSTVVTKVSFTVTAAPPTLTISPTTGSVKVVNTITLTGSNYAFSTSYGKCVSADTTTAGCISSTIGTFTSSGSGTIPSSTTITVPINEAPGTYYALVYTGSTVNARATYLLSCPAGQQCADPAPSGPAGSMGSIVNVVVQLMPLVVLIGVVSFIAIYLKKFSAGKSA